MLNEVNNIYRTADVCIFPIEVCRTVCSYCSLMDLDLSFVCFLIFALALQPTTVAAEYVFV